jgi:hypothetical protein
MTPLAVPDFALVAVFAPTGVRVTSRAPSGVVCVPSSSA